MMLCEYIPLPMNTNTPAVRLDPSLLLVFLKCKTHEHLDASHNFIFGNEPSLEILTHQSQNLEWAKTGKTNCDLSRSSIGNLDILYTISNYFQ